MQITLQKRRPFVTHQGNGFIAMGTFTKRRKATKQARRSRRINQLKK